MSGDVIQAPSRWDGISELGHFSLQTFGSVRRIISVVERAPPKITTAQNLESFQSGSSLHLTPREHHIVLHTAATLHSPTDGQVGEWSAGTEFEGRGDEMMRADERGLRERWGEVERRNEK